MKTGILTFHWATNYGAVLQAYALQKYLSQYGHDCTIIDYVPFPYQKTIVKCFFTRFPIKIMYNLCDYFKEKRIDRFRKEYFNLTKRYQTFAELQDSNMDFDVYVCGSDQIWNPSFTTKGEGKTTLSYFLDFAGAGKLRLAYAASFGCTSYPQELINIIKPVLSRFNALSVREHTGLSILENMGVHGACLLPDPTLLLHRRDYEGFLSKNRQTPTNCIFVYALHNGQRTIQNVRRFLGMQKDQNIRYVGFRSLSLIGIEEWLSSIAISKAVVTNSFHGVVFSILFKKPFIAIPVEGSNSGMNDRLNTLLKNLGLYERLIYNYDEDRIIELICKQIDWPSVEIRVNAAREDASVFIKKNFRV